MQTDLPPVVRSFTAAEKAAKFRHMLAVDRARGDEETAFIAQLTQQGRIPVGIRVA